MLHLIFTSPFSHPRFQHCLEIVAKNDAVLLLEDGVYAATKNTLFAEQLSKKNIATYALSVDCEARGIHPMPTINVINYDEFVELTLKYFPIQNW